MHGSYRPLLASILLLWMAGGAAAQNVEIQDRGAIFLCSTERDAQVMIADAQNARSAR